MKLRINEKDTSMKYKTYGNIEKCFNILVNEKGYSKEEAQDIIDHMLADYKYNPNSNDSLLRRVNLVLSKDEYEKEYGIAESIRINERNTNDTISLKDVIKNAKIAAKRDGYSQDIFIDKNGEYGFVRHFPDNLSDWNGEQLIGQVQTNWDNGIFSVSYVDDESLFRTYTESKETPNIEVKHKGILEVPEGKNVDDLPLSHFVNLANKKGLSKITKALNNLQVWNKNDDKELSKWAGNMIDKLNKKLKKDESLKESIYTDMGFSDRKEYLNSLADDYGVDIQTVYDLASVLGPDEDFDALVTELEDLMYNGEDTFKSFDQELHYDLLHYNYVVCDKDVDIFDFIIVHFDTYEDAIRCVFNNLGWFVSDCVLYDTRKHLKITYAADKLDISKLDTGKNTVYDLDDFKSNPLRFIDKYTVGEDAAIENARKILDMCEVSTEKY